MKVGEAMEVLGLLGTALDELSADDVRAAFARAARNLHPDTNTGLEGVKRSMAPLQLARNMLLQEITNQNNACALCCGTGKVRGRIGMQGCSACEGTGERK